MESIKDLSEMTYGEKIEAAALKMTREELIKRIILLEMDLCEAEGVSYESSMYNSLVDVLAKYNN